MRFTTAGAFRGPTPHVGALREAPANRFRFQQGPYPGLPTPYRIRLPPVRRGSRPSPRRRPIYLLSPHRRSRSSVGVRPLLPDTLRRGLPHPPRSCDDPSRIPRRRVVDVQTLAGTFRSIPEEISYPER